MTEDIARYVAVTIAASKVEEARKKLRPKLLQAAQLEGGRIVDYGDGVVADYVECPACTIHTPEEDSSSYIEVTYPVGLEATERQETRKVRLELLPDDVLLWAVKHGVLKVSLDNKVFDVYSNDPDAQSAYNCGVVYGSLAEPQTTPVLNVIPAAKLKEG